MEKHRDFPGNYSIVMVPFAWEVAAGYGNLTVLNASFRDSLKRRIYVIGHESDVDTYLQLLDSLTLQVRTALRVWQRENADARRNLTDMEKYVQHRSFISGYGHTVRTRLEALRAEAERYVSTGAELVLVEKQAKVDEWVENKYPDLKAKNSNMRWSLAGAMAGREAGAKADIGQKSTKGKKTKEVVA